MFKTHPVRAGFICVLQAFLVFPATSAEPTTMSISDLPLDIAFRKSNIFFDMDNSGSMDWEIITDKAGRFTLDSAIPWYVSRTASHRIGHLFPAVENDTDGITVGNGTNTIAPATSEFAYLRSPDFNKIYYNPRVDYSPWDKAYDGGDISFSAADPSAARSHPYYLTSGVSTTCSGSSSCSLLNLRVVNESYISVARNVLVPLTVPGPGGSDLAVKNSNGNAIGSAYTTSAVTTLIVPNYPATYWLKDSSCTSSTYPSSDWRTCAAAPDGQMMRRYDIVNDSRFSGNGFTLPDGTVINRSRVQELQNFANWYSFYRKRKLLAAGSIANTLDNLQKSQSRIVAGFVPFNNRSSGTPTMYDFSLADTTANAATNGRSLIARFYRMLAQGGTPTLGTLSYSAGRYGYTDSPFLNTDTGNAQLRCQINTSIVVTDGFANDYSGRNSLYAIAKSAYDAMRWWSPFKAAFPSATTYTTGNLGNTMNTYAITLGARGNLFGVSPTPTALPNPQTSSLWSNPTDDSPTAIDDLWRATLYSRGKMLLANNPTELQAGMSSILASLIKASSDTNITVSNVNVKAGDNLAVYGTYSPSDWTGDLKAYPINLTSGVVEMTTAVWSARELLDARTADSRIIATWDGSAGVPFRSSSMSSTLKSAFNTGSNSDADDVINWLRGDRSKENDLYRARNGILGDIVNSQPVYVAGAVANYPDSGYAAFKTSIASRKRVVYVGANDGMLHAFDATYCAASSSSSSASSSSSSASTCVGGQELWAYVPQLVHDKLNALSKPAYMHTFNVDGRITVWDANLGTSSAPDWRTVLVAGLRHGGKGFFALDVTSPVYANEAALSSKVLWEFTDSDMGETFGKPIIVNTKNHGWVALLTSGYNNTDGKGYLYVVSLKDGTLIKKIATLDGSVTAQVGLAQIAALASETSAINSAGKSSVVKWVYGGDLNGNVWRFDLSADDKANWGVKKIASGLGIGVAQPITTAPELAYIDTSNTMPTYQNVADVKASRLMIYVGTGKILHGNDIDSASDTTTSQKNGFFAFEDANDSLVINEGACANLTCLVANGLGQDTASNGLNNWGTVSNSSLTSWWQIDRHSFDWNNQQRVKRGWYIKFSETGGESVITDPTVAYGFVSFTTTMKTDSRHGTAGVCETTYSALYILATDKGGELGTQSRWNLGFGIATTPAIYTTTTTTTTGDTTAENKVHATTCLQGNCQTVDPNVTIPTSANTLRRWGWREIYR